VIKNDVKIDDEYFKNSKKLMNVKNNINEYLESLQREIEVEYKENIEKIKEENEKLRDENAKLREQLKNEQNRAASLKRFINHRLKCLEKKTNEQNDNNIKMECKYKKLEEMIQMYKQNVREQTKTLNNAFNVFLTNISVQ